jgi:hypothetical protein
MVDNEDTMNKLKLIVGVILVILVGALAGSLVTGIYYKHRLERFASDRASHHLRKVVMKRLTNKLDLTKEQRTEITKVVKESQRRIFSILRDYLPEIREINDQSFALMKEKLNPEQKVKLVKLHEKLKDRHAKAFIQSIQIEESSDQVLSKMKEQLNLTEEQVIIAQPIIEESIKERRTIIQKYKANDRPDFYSLKREIRELQESVEKRLTQILTAKQMQKYLDIQKEERRKMRSEKRRHGSIL